jgi:hypothetical protein
MKDLLRSKCLYRITLGKEKEPTNDDKKAKWVNRSDEARGLIGMSISPDLRYHLQEIDDPKEAWEKIESMFGKLNIIQAQQLKNQVLTLSPSDFSCLGDYLSRFKTNVVYVVSAMVRNVTSRRHQRKMLENVARPQKNTKTLIFFKFLNL